MSLEVWCKQKHGMSLMKAVFLVIYNIDCFQIEIKQFIKSFFPPIFVCLSILGKMKILIAPNYNIYSSIRTVHDVMTTVSVILEQNEVML